MFSLLSLYFSLSISVDPIATQETYTDSHGVFLDAHVLTKGTKTKSIVWGGTVRR